MRSRLFTALFFPLFLLLFLVPFAWSLQFKAGDRVEALWDGAWYKAKIRHVLSDGRYEVQFEGYWNDRAKPVKEEEVRSIPARQHPYPEDLKPGDSVEFLDGDHWRGATFKELKEDRVRVEYLDKETKKEKWIPIRRLWKPWKAEPKKVIK